MAITRDFVDHTAALARLDLRALSETELDALHRDLDAILEYVAQLDELDLVGVEPTTHAVPIRLPLRPDEPQPGPGRAALFANAPQTDGEFFLVPRVLAE
jgi:aspartyl-tRNA(Asn)/glutamyl-tRNA(Gln) amidotransferase subunit C